MPRRVDVFPPLSPPYRRDGLDGFNAIGPMLRKAFGREIPSLDPDRILAAARRRARLDDIGPPEAHTALEVLARSHDEEARLNLVGRIMVSEQLKIYVRNRLKIRDLLARQPEIAAQPVARPVFIISLPRTGSTLLHNLMASDPRVRFLQEWEALAPCPAPTQRRYQRNWRRFEMRWRIRGLDQLAPHMAAIHPIHAEESAEECVPLLANSLRSFHFWLANHIPSYASWLDAQDVHATYAEHKEQLQILQWHIRRDRWVLKSPSHLFALDALLDVYPDARIVFLHRDPAKVMGSLASMAAVLHGMQSDHVDLDEIGAMVLERFSAGMARAIDVREARPEARILDVHYADVVADPVGTVRRIHEAFDDPFDAATDAGMRRWLADNPQRKYGHHTYTLADFGLTADAVHRHFGRYVERYAVPEESSAA